ncbi:unnamed protein product, partial [Gongylonema pulchrum]|uniref:Chromo domain-containing protein n=1 Tax=Gongylonema pulchrum TaxID=637853 RepID=A0A183DMY3_9BILA
MCSTSEQRTEKVSAVDVSVEDSFKTGNDPPARLFGGKLVAEEVDDDSRFAERPEADVKPTREELRLSESRKSASETEPEIPQNYGKNVEEKVCKMELCEDEIKRENADEEERTELSTEATTAAQESTAEEEKLEKEESSDKPAKETTPKRRKGRRQKRGPSKKKKIEEVETGPEVDDEEFIPEKVRKSRRRTLRRRRNEDSSDTPVEYVEKRRSGRTANAEKKSYDLQAKWDEMDEEIGEDEKSFKGKKIEEQSEFIIEKIMGVKKNTDGPDTYFVKYKNKAYIHCEWKSQEELEEGDKRAASKLKRFHQRRAHNSEQDDEEQFNS